MAPGSRHIFEECTLGMTEFSNLRPSACAGSHMSSNNKPKMASNRQPVAKGGLWTSHSAPVSKETQNLLKGNTRFLRDTSQRFSCF